MLPVALVNIIGHFAYGEGKYNLEDELAYISGNRGMIPVSFLEPTMTKLGRVQLHEPPFSVDCRRPWSL